MTSLSYIHEYVRASSITEDKGAFGLGMPKEVASPYPHAQVEDHLNQRAGEGWRLVSMEPRWYYEQKNISGASAIARPLAIVGWYLTFERGTE